MDHQQIMDADLRAILVEHGLEDGAWRLEKVGILTEAQLPSLWDQDEDFFGDDGYSRGAFEIFKELLQKYSTTKA